MDKPKVLGIGQLINTDTDEVILTAEIVDNGVNYTIDVIHEPGQTNEVSMNKELILEVIQAAKVAPHELLTLGFEVLDTTPPGVDVRLTLSKGGVQLFVGPTRHLRAGDTYNITDVRI